MHTQEECSERNVYDVYEQVGEWPEAWIPADTQSGPGDECEV